MNGFILSLLAKVFSSLFDIMMKEINHNKVVRKQMKDIVEQKDRVETAINQADNNEPVTKEELKEIRDAYRAFIRS